jgi:hypothetical protein
MFVCGALNLDISSPFLSLETHFAENLALPRGLRGCALKKTAYLKNIDITPLCGTRSLSAGVPARAFMALSTDTTCHCYMLHVTFYRN